MIKKLNDKNEKVRIELETNREVKANNNFEDINCEEDKEVKESAQAENNEINNSNLEDIPKNQDVNVDNEKENTDANKYNLEKFIPAKSKSVERRFNGAGALTVVYAKTGVRISLANEVYQKLGAPDKLQCSYLEDVIAISEKLPNTQNSYNVKKSGNKAIVYSSSLVKEIINYFNLDFQNKTSITFNEAEYSMNGSHPVVIIKVK